MQPKIAVRIVRLTFLISLTNNNLTMGNGQNTAMFVLMLFSIVFIAIATFITYDISNYTLPNIRRNLSKASKPMPIQNMYLVYYNGYILDMGQQQVKKNVLQ